MEGIDFTTSNALAGSSNNTDDNDAKFQTVKNYSSIKKEKCDVKKKFQSQGRTPVGNKDRNNKLKKCLLGWFIITNFLMS